MRDPPRCSGALAIPRPIFPELYGNWEQPPLTPAANSGGPTLYNGIVLPAQWPPAGSPTQTYSIPAYIANPPATIPIDVGRQLFVDDFLIQETTMVRAQHRPVMYAGNPVLAPNGVNTDTDNKTFPESDGVWFDPQDHQFKMWFHCGFGTQICYATSIDGKNWVRPSIPGAPVNNTDVVLGPVGSGLGSSVVWMDLQDPNPAHRFKLFGSQRSVKHAYLVFTGRHYLGKSAFQYPRSSGRLPTSPAASGRVRTKTIRLMFLVERSRNCTISTQLLTKA